MLDNHCELSVYNDQPMTATDSAIVVKKLSVAFPAQSNEFFVLLAQRMLANGFTHQRANDAVNWLIDNFAYKQINIADVIKFDKKRKVYTYHQAISMLTCNGGIYPDLSAFSRLELNEKKYFYLENE